MATAMMIEDFIKHFLLVATLTFIAAKAEIRCFCNQPSCVSTGYMCKSQSSVCFAELFSFSRDPAKSRQGCIELLSPKKRKQCQVSPSEIIAFPAILCCVEDMCNYMNTVDIDVPLREARNHTAMRDAYSLDEDQRLYHSDFHQDVWFKAAVIAVPIIGGFILVLLIFVASRMLRQDSKWQGQLIELRRQQEVFVRPHTTNTAQNFQKYCALYKNTASISGCQNSCCTATIEEKSMLDTRNSVCSVLLPWTKWKPPKTLTHV